MIRHLTLGEYADLMADKATDLFGIIVECQPTEETLYKKETCDLGNPSQRLKALFYLTIEDGEMTFDDNGTPYLKLTVY